MTLLPQASVSGQLTLYVNDAWPVGPGYEVRIWHPEVGQIISTMIVVVP